MGTLKSRSLPEGHVTQIEFSAIDLRTFRLAAGDEEFARSMAMMLWAVGDVSEQRSISDRFKRHLIKSIESVGKTRDLLREMPPTLSHSLVNTVGAVDSELQRLVDQRNRLFPKKKPIDIHTRRILHGVAHQMRKRRIKVSASAESGSMRMSPFISIAQTLLRVSGKTLDPVTIKKHARHAGVLNFPALSGSIRANSGWEGIFISEGNFSYMKVAGGSLRLMCDEYTPRLGWRGFQFHLAPV